ncbi:hypothetical protein CK203_088008 [Vitis vinifera]|uniref:DNA2/NAM7 helicase helicase domain-containing protein n=1 Tax=Vitis vinifera TaxID=29760 RepID=A0A438ER77_VITVI|nr:hypothetical protein CK203_088008 [Vitis vinifera]
MPIDDPLVDSSLGKPVDLMGPPGTGKTQTILGLLSAILHATPARVHSR